MNTELDQRKCPVFCDPELLHTCTLDYPDHQDSRATPPKSNRNQRGRFVCSRFLGRSDALTGQKRQAAMRVCIIFMCL